MESYSEYFGYLITHCRDNALEELRSNQRYMKLREEEKNAVAGLTAIISPEAQTVFEKYLETSVAVKAMECNRTLLCGLTAQVEMRKRFDASTPEYKEFSDEYL